MRGVEKFMPESHNLSANFNRNYCALAMNQKELAHRVCLPSIDDHITGEPPQLKLQRFRYPLRLAPEVVEQVGVQTTGETILVFGVGLGELVVEVLRTNPMATVIAWDRDPVMLRKAMERQDFTLALYGGRLRLALGPDLIEVMGQAPDKVVYHPLLRQVYHLEADLLERGVEAPRALICAGGLFVDDVAASLQQQGMGVYTWDLLRLSTEELDRVVEQVRPELVFSINHVHGLAEACHGHDVPLLVWEIDPCTDGLRPPGTDTHHVAIHTYRQANVERFRAAGFSNVTYTPLAANTKRRSPSPTEVQAGPEVCFVGASMVAQSRSFRRQFLDVWVECSENNPQARAQGQQILDAVLKTQRSRPRTYLVPILMQRHFDSFLAKAEKLLVDDPVAMVGEMAAAERRLNIVAALGTEGIHVWGDPGWKATQGRGVVYRGYAGHNEQLTGIYRRGRVHVDVNRLYQMDIVPMRVFDILACGGFLIAEQSPALGELFELGVEVESWSSIPELIDKVRYFRAHPEQAETIALAGLRAVQERHSIQGRVFAMLADLPGKHEIPLAG
jgi:spore maturation protein CgeB